MEERRRWPRRRVDGEFATLSASSDVRILDISESGAMFSSHRELRPGTRCRLRLTLGRAPFAADVEVRRAEPSPSIGGGFLIGVQFVALDPVDRQRIERFVTQ